MRTLYPIALPAALAATLLTNSMSSSQAQAPGQTEVVYLSNCTTGLGTIKSSEMDYYSDYGSSVGHQPEAIAQVGQPIGPYGSYVNWSAGLQAGRFPDGDVFVSNITKTGVGDVDGTGHNNYHSFACYGEAGPIGRYLYDNGPKTCMSQYECLHSNSR
jgi:hypothetical protein